DRTGVAAADFSRIRNADLGRFTVDRLMSIINRLGSRVEVKIRVRPIERAAQRGDGMRAAKLTHDVVSRVSLGRTRRTR
ncbi:MAG: XRE family transcriptional regulator, partial [Terriglobia bacterium]